MNRATLSFVSLAGAFAVSIVAATAQSATAAPSPAGAKGRPAHVATGQHAPSAKMPQLAASAVLPGYRQVTSDLLTDSAGAQVGGTAVCPTGTKVIGGGAVISGASLSENLNSSLPESNGTTWEVYVDNSSGTDGTFRVYADCVKKLSKYSVVAGTGVDNPAGEQGSALVTCPTGTFPLGGGGIASSGSTLVNLNTSIESTKGWRVDMNNASTSDSTTTAYAVCAKKPSGYTQVSGTSTTIAASSQASATVACPSGTVVFGGGAFSNSGSTSVNLNSSAPSGSTGWTAYENNASGSSTTLTAYAVCADATA